MARSVGRALVALALTAVPLPASAAPLLVYCTHDPDAYALAA